MALFRRRGPRAEAHRPDDQVAIQALSDDALLERYRALDNSIEGPDPDDRARQLDLLASEVLRRHPEASSFWYDRGMYAKWRQDWSESLRLNRVALDLVPAAARAGDPAAWNLGIAATAQRDWRTARFAWAQFGIDLPDGESDDSPVVASFGLAPLRLNAEPRFVGQPVPQVDGRTYLTEVVWGDRVCPARIRIANVPTPESGHRFGDVVLHDGDTLGSRRLGEREVGVFNEISLWERSPNPTMCATVQAPNQAAVTELMDLFDMVGGALEDWTQNVQILCRACSEGSPGVAHTHGEGGTEWVTERRVGMAGQPDQVRVWLDQWADHGAQRSYSDLELALA
jgi:hypothetical protein